jgi:hypothetical protein
MVLVWLNVSCLPFYFYEHRSRSGAEKGKTKTKTCRAHPAVYDQISAMSVVPPPTAQTEDSAKPRGGCARKKG